MPSFPLIKHHMTNLVKLTPRLILSFFLIFGFLAHAKNDTSLEESISQDNRVISYQIFPYPDPQNPSVDHPRVNIVVSVPTLEKLMEEKDKTWDDGFGPTMLAVLGDFKRRFLQGEDISGNRISFVFSFSH